MPNTYSASVTARVISRMLRKAGFTMADTSDRYSWTEGFYVRRVGFSNKVSIDYHLPQSSRFSRPTDYKQIRIDNNDKARTFLLEKGYQFDPKYSGLWITCERD